jgi:hypothetical protein
MIQLGIKQFLLYISEKQVLCVDIVIQSDQKSLCARVFSGVRWKTRCIRTIPTQLMIWRWPSQNTFGMWTVLHWKRSSRTQFSVSINVWRLARDTLNITCNFLYCNYHVHRDFLIILYISRKRIKHNTLSDEALEKTTEESYWYFEIGTGQQLAQIHDSYIIIIIIIIGEDTIYFKQGIYSYIPETNHVPKEYNYYYHHHHLKEADCVCVCVCVWIEFMCFRTK